MEKQSMRGMADTLTSTRMAKRKRRFAEATLVLTLVVLFIAITLLTSNALSISSIWDFKSTFFTWNNQYNLVRQTSINGIVAIGMTFVIISGGIDLSVGAVVGSSGILAALLMKDYNQSVLVSCLAGVLVSAAVGVINGVLIYHGRVPPFIATLGTMTMLRGSIMLASDARNIAGLPRSFSDFAQQDLFGLPNLFVVWLIIIALGWFITRNTVFGRKVYAIGSNVEATRLSGVDLKWVYYGTYMVCSLFCGVAGILYASRLRSGIPTGGQGYEMDAIAASVIGGASLSGAEGSILGTVLGAIVMAMLRNGGNLLGINPFVLEIVIGALIVVAVLIDQNRKARG